MPGPTTPTAPDPHAHPTEGAVRDERHLASSPHATAANAAVLALTRAARSFTLYDPANNVVRGLIADYRDKLERVLADFGPLVLEVHPFELLVAGEIVYLEKDRERSLAFRLFRDGVRAVAFEPGATWDELLRLLQILSIRYTGVRQQEDDLVTLLRKADFAHVRIAAIEGFVPEEEQAETAAEPLRRERLEHHDPPTDWDLPLPPFQETVPLRYRTVPEEALTLLRAEESAESVPRHAARAVAELLQASGQDDLPAVLALALEVRDFLLVERRGDLVAELGRMTAVTLSAQSELAARFLSSYLDAPTIEGLAQSLQPNAEAPAALLELLDSAPAGTPERLLESLARSGENQAPGLRRLAAHAFRHAPQALATRLPQASGATAVALLQVLAELEPAAALRRATEAAGSADPVLRKEALRQLAETPFNPELAHALLRLTHSPLEEVRTAAAACLKARRGEHG